MTTYRISQLAQRVGLRPTTLRFYEQAGLLPARRSDSGYRVYDDRAVDRLTFITTAKTLGLPLDEIRDLLDVWADGLCTDVRVRLRPILVARVADAEQRAAELDAFIDRLRHALAEVDGPPLPGRCEPDCGFFRHDDTPAPVPVEPLSHRPAGPSGPPPGDVPIACTLDGDDQADRVRHWQRLLARAVHRATIDGGLRVELPASVAGEVAGLAAAEQRCCPFFAFTLHLAGPTVWLDVRAPVEAAALLAEVFGTARPAIR
ncbi:MAG TPA: MerR family transcriptional regulator [Pseudonocardiaceae bacterium]|nr:MerR family transcriptional regulator [Pseudonocardiaceae bacterium]